MKPSNERDDDRGETVAGRHRWQQLTDRSGHLPHAGETGTGAAYQHAKPHHSVRVETRVFRGVAGESRHPQLKAEKTAIQEHVTKRHGREGDQKSEIETSPFDENRIERGIGELLRLRKVEALGITPRFMNQP